MAGRQSAIMDEAEKLVTVYGFTAKKAAEHTGVSINSIYRSAWWKALRAQKEKAE